MSTHKASVVWSRTTPNYTYETYDRSHLWKIAAHEIPASAAREFLGDESRVNPEEAFVAALSSCHMLTFLAIAARKGLVVDHYEDDAEGVLEKEGGRLWMTRVVLRPRVVFGGGLPPGEEVVAPLHESSHAGCFIANSVKTAVTIEPR